MARKKFLEQADGQMYFNFDVEEKITNKNNVVEATVTKTNKKGDLLRVTIDGVEFKKITKKDGTNIMQETRMANETKEETMAPATEEVIKEVVAEVVEETQPEETTEEVVEETVEETAYTPNFILQGKPCDDTKFQEDVRMALVLHEMAKRHEDAVAAVGGNQTVIKEKKNHNGIFFIIGCLLLGIALIIIAIILANGHGRDGANGADGKNGTVVTIIDGYWYLDGENTGIAATGEKGEQGIQGEPGKDGIDGKDGKDGIDGKDGKDGKDGINGKDGKDGINGIDGKDGRDGVNGVDGKDSLNGKDGQDGKDGVDGADGKDGEIIIVNPNDTTIEYGRVRVTYGIRTVVDDDTYKVDTFTTWVVGVVGQSYTHQEIQALVERQIPEGRLDGTEFWYIKNSVDTYTFTNDKYAEYPAEIWYIQ